MASLFGSYSQLLSLPITRTRHTSPSSSQLPPPPPQPPLQPSQPPIGRQVPLAASARTATNKKPGTNAESTDWIASSLTRRFGLGAGLAWAAFLAVGVVSEQIKTRIIEVSHEGSKYKVRDVEKQEEVVLLNGLRYSDLRVGGGASPTTGDLVVIGLKGVVQGTGQVFVDTFGDKKKPLALVMGTRPYSKGMCEGIDYAMRSMKAEGKRSVVVPPNLGYGDEGADLGSGILVPPKATLEYIVEVDRVSIAPS